LFAAIGLVAVLALASAFAIGALLARRTVERNTLRDVSAQADLLAEKEREELLPCSRLGGLDPFLQRQGQRTVCVSLNGSSPYLPEQQARLVRIGLPVDGTVVVDGERYFYAARNVKQKAYLLLRPTDLAASSWRPHMRGLLFAALATAVLAALAAFLLSRAIARPVRRVAQASTSLAETGAAPRVPVEGPRELAQLAASFNEMADQLAKAREAERAFLLSVSHELKTPLTAVRGYAEAIQEGAVDVDEAAETILREGERLERLVTDLLDLARMNRAEFSVRRDEIDLGEAAREAVRRYESKARQFGVELEATVEEPADALGDADRMLQVVSNLVENALRLVPAGGSVRVLARRGEIAVEDTGPGLKADELPRAFERFFLYARYGKERPVGTGLGLAIVKQLTEGMGGRVHVESEPGRRTRFTVTLATPPVRARGRELTPAV
jgi:signal transduction histidine kinase